MTVSVPKPCPDQILSTTASHFALGAVGGTAYYFRKGFYDFPSGARFIGGAQAVRMNVPRLAGRFALWGGLIATFRSTLNYVRQNEDRWNWILAGAAASGLVFRPMARSALHTAAFFTLFSGIEVTIERVFRAQQPMQQVTYGEAPQVEDKAL